MENRIVKLELAPGEVILIRGALVALNASFKRAHDKCVEGSAMKAALKNDIVFVQQTLDKVKA